VLKNKKINKSTQQTLINYIILKTMLQYQLKLLNFSQFFTVNVYVKLIFKTKITPRYESKE